MPYMRGVTVSAMFVERYNSLPTYHKQLTDDILDKICANHVLEWQRGKGGQRKGEEYRITVGNRPPKYTDSVLVVWTYDANRNPRIEGVTIHTVI